MAVNLRFGCALPNKTKHIHALPGDSGQDHIASNQSGFTDVIHFTRQIISVELPSSNCRNTGPESKIAFDRGQTVSVKKICSKHSISPGQVRWIRQVTFEALFHQNGRVELSKHVVEMDSSTVADLMSAYGAISVEFELVNVTHALSPNTQYTTPAFEGVRIGIQSSNLPVRMERGIILLNLETLGAAKLTSADMAPMNEFIRELQV